MPSLAILFALVACQLFQPVNDSVFYDGYEDNPVPGFVVGDVAIVQSPTPSMSRKGEDLHLTPSFVVGECSASPIE